MGKRSKGSRKIAYRIAETMVMKRMSSDLAGEIIKTAREWRGKRLSVSLRAETEAKTEWAYSMGGILRVIISEILNFTSVGYSNDIIVPITVNRFWQDPSNRREGIRAIMREWGPGASTNDQRKWWQNHLRPIVRGICVSFQINPTECEWLREFISEVRQVYPRFEFHAIMYQFDISEDELKRSIGDIATSIHIVGGGNEPMPRHQIHLCRFDSLETALHHISQLSRRARITLFCVNSGGNAPWLTQTTLELVLLELSRIDVCELRIEVWRIQVKILNAFIMHTEALEELHIVAKSIVGVSEGTPSPKWTKNSATTRITPISFAISILEGTEYIEPIFRELVKPVLQVVPISSFRFSYGNTFHSYQIAESCIHRITQHVNMSHDIDAAYRIDAGFMDCIGKTAICTPHYDIAVPPDMKVMKFLSLDNVTSLDVCFCLTKESTSSTLVYLCKTITYNRRLEELSLNITGGTGKINVGHIYKAILDAKRATLLRKVKIKFTCDTASTNEDFDILCKLLIAKVSIRSFAVEFSSDHDRFKKSPSDSAEAIVNLLESNKTLKEFYGFTIAPPNYSLCDMDDILTAFEFNQIMVIKILTEISWVRYPGEYWEGLSNLWHYRYLKALFKHYENDVRLTKLAGLSGVLRYVKRKRHLYDQVLTRLILEFAI